MMAQRHLNLRVVLIVMTKSATVVREESFKSQLSTPRTYFDRTGETLVVTFTNHPNLN